MGEGNAKNITQVKVIIQAFLMIITLFMLALFLFVYSWFADGYTGSIIGPLLRVKTHNISIYLSGDNGDNWIEYKGTPIDIFISNIYNEYGSDVDLLVKLYNHGNVNLEVSIYFPKPNVGLGVEIPYVNNNVYYYLGSQIQISKIVASKDDIDFDISSYVVGDGKYLVLTSSSNVSKGQNTGYDTFISDIPRLDLINYLPILAKETLIITTRLSFIDNGELQNVYQDPFPGMCKRVVSFTVK